jgi:hypothetical protein
MDSLEQEVWLRYKVRVEYRNKITLGALETHCKCPGLVAHAVEPLKVMDVETLESIVLDLLPCNVSGLVGRVVEHLDLEEVPGIVESGNGIDEAFYDIDLVE